MRRQVPCLVACVPDGDQLDPFSIPRDARQRLTASKWCGRRDERVALVLNDEAVFCDFGELHVGAVS